MVVVDTCSNVSDLIIMIIIVGTIQKGEESVFSLQSTRSREWRLSPTSQMDGVELSTFNIWQCIFNYHEKNLQLFWCLFWVVCFARLWSYLSLVAHKKNVWLGHLLWKGLHVSWEHWNQRLGSQELFWLAWDYA